MISTIGTPDVPPAMPVRLAAIRQLAQRLSARREDILRAGALDAGFPVKVTAGEIDLAVNHLLTMEEEIPRVEGGRPFGTVACIFPYDAPAVFLARLGGGALLTGNRLLFSFSSLIPRSAKIIAEIVEPFAALQPVLNRDNRDFGRECVEDPAVRVLFISGASGVGEAYRKQHQAFDKLIFAGPGGMPAAVVFGDADPEAAARFIARRAYINGGQYCTTLKKALIHESLYTAVCREVLEATRRLKVGDPLDPETDMGPIRVPRTIESLRAALATFTRDPSQGHLLHGSIENGRVSPLLIETSHIPDLELFGPLLALKPFTRPEEAVEEVIASRYGFLLATFGTPPPGAGDLFHEHFGMIHADPTFELTPLRLPFGGRKASGWILEKLDGQWKERDGAFLYSKELVH